MASGNIERNTFVRGLITEASPINFPENASIDEENFILRTDGTRKRRLGLEQESGGIFINTDYYNGESFLQRNMQVFLWKNAGLTGVLDIYIIKAGSRFYFFDGSQGLSSTNILNGGNSILQSNLQDQTISGASINGDFIITPKDKGNIKYFKYDSNTDTVSVGVSLLKIRDTYGIDDSLGVEERPTVLTDEHWYNLLNQGWLTGRIAAFFNVETRYPNNADLVHLGKTNVGTFDPNLISNTVFGTSKASRGRFIIDPFNRGLHRQIEAGAVTQFNDPTFAWMNSDSENGELSSITAAFGRIFYSGIASSSTDPWDTTPNYTGSVFFTKVVETRNDYSVCHQESDPTSEIDNQLLSSDGGIIKIADSGVITHMVPLSSSLLLFSKQGVWEVSGADGIFRADDYSVKEITNRGLLNKESVVVVNDAVYYWSTDGIYVITHKNNSVLINTNITSKTIETFYNTLHKSYNAPTSGVYNEIDNSIHWLTSTSPSVSGTYFDGALIFNLNLQAFYKYSFKSGSQAVAITGIIQPDVLGDKNIRYLTIHKEVGQLDKFTFSTTTNTDFEDYSVDASAFMITGNEMFQDTQRIKQVNYLTMHHMRTETGFTTVGGDLEALNQSGCIVSPNWGFSTGSCTGLPTYQTYKSKDLITPTASGDYIFCRDVITSKTKIRGSGRAYSMKIETEPKKDLHLLGWALSVEGRSNA